MDSYRTTKYTIDDRVEKDVSLPGTDGGRNAESDALTCTKARPTDLTQRKLGGNKKHSDADAESSAVTSTTENKKTLKRGTKSSESPESSTSSGSNRSKQQAIEYVNPAFVFPRAKPHDVSLIIHDLSDLIYSGVTACYIFSLFNRSICAVVRSSIALSQICWFYFSFSTLSRKMYSFGSCNMAYLVDRSSL